MENSADISKVIGMILQNPEMMEMIKAMGSSVKGEEDPLKEDDTVKEIPTEAKSSSENTYPDTSQAALARRKKRHDLLCAIKPYVSKDRGRAIDTMLSLSDVLDVMKGG